VNQSWDVVISSGANAIPAVISEVVYEEVKFVRKQRPKGIVEVGCEPASVAQDNPDVGIRIAVLSYGRRCLVVYLNPAN